MLKRKESQGLGLIAEERETLQIQDVVECVCQPENRVRNEHAKRMFILMSATQCVKT